MLSRLRKGIKGHNNIVMHIHIYKEVDAENVNLWAQECLYQLINKSEAQVNIIHTCLRSQWRLPNKAICILMYALVLMKICVDCCVQLLIMKGW